MELLKVLNQRFMRLLNRMTSLRATNIIKGTPVYVIVNDIQKVFNEFDIPGKPLFKYRAVRENDGTIRIEFMYSPSPNSPPSNVRSGVFLIKSDGTTSVNNPDSVNVIQTLKPGVHIAVDEGLSAIQKGQLRELIRDVLYKGENNNNNNNHNGGRRKNKTHRRKHRMSRRRKTRAKARK